MSENKENSEEEKEEDDLQTYLKEIEMLESDFSDLDDLDFEEIQEMQEAIAKVQESEDSSEIVNEINEQAEMEISKTLDKREDMLTDFSDLDEIDFDELKDMQEAIETVKQEEPSIEQEGVIKPKQDLSQELEERIKLELLKRKEEEKAEIVTPEKFLNYLKPRRDKIWYHALYYITFEVEDHTASKALLYDELKEDTSKSPIDPIPENRFYFGLGYLLRLTLNEKQIVRFLKGGKFKINVAIDSLKELLKDAGEPIITKPIIEESEKKKMFKDFLSDDFRDI